MEIEIKSNTKDLEQLIKGLLKEKIIDIGVFDNPVASVAYDMEFGKPNSYIPQLHKTVNVPPRSFLQVPIQEELANNKPRLDEKKLVRFGMNYIAKKIKDEALNIVEATFHNEGYDNWAANDPEWKEYKEKHGYDPKILGYKDVLKGAIEGKCR